MRVDVDFNERDRQGHVVTRVPGEQIPRLAPGRRVYLYDPLERLWAEASVARVNEDTQIAAFAVDWRSFTDAEVADVRIGREQWFVGVPPGEGHQLPPFVFTENCNVAELAPVKCRIRFGTARPGQSDELVLSTWSDCNSAAGTQGVRT
jgi:hypothetical protein